jgi:hypothetical protein
MLRNIAVAGILALGLGGCGVESSDYAKAEEACSPFGGVEFTEGTMAKCKNGLLIKRIEVLKGIQAR